MRFAALILGALLASCAITPAHVLDWMDAETDGDREQAVLHAAKLLADPRQPVDVRMSAAKVLGRLHRPDAEAVSALSEALLDPGADPGIHAYAAWALGELRAPASLAVATRALSAPLDPRSGELLLEAIAKHDALIASDPERTVELIEQLTRFAANQGGRLPPVYDLIGAKTRSVPINVKVLERAIAGARGNEQGLAAAYVAAFELFDSLDRARSEITADEAAWRAPIKAAVEEARAAMELGDRPTTALALWNLGRLADQPAIASSAALALVGTAGDKKDRPTLAPSGALRLLSAWALARMQLHAPGPRRCLARDVLAKEPDPSVLRLIGEISAHREEHDQLQKILEVGR